MSPELGRLLIVVGLTVAGVGLLAVLGIGIPLGRLPGDIRIEGERSRVNIPIVSMLIVSLVLSLLLTLFRRFL